MLSSSIQAANDAYVEALIHHHHGQDITIAQFWKARHFTQSIFPCNISMRTYTASDNALHDGLKLLQKIPYSSKFP